MDYLQYKNYLAHHGIEGQKWGVRRYQNADGSLTPEGRARYYGQEYRKAKREWQSEHGKITGYNKEAFEKSFKEKYSGDYMADKTLHDKKVKKAMIIGGTAAATALVAIGTYKAIDIAKTYNFNQESMERITGNHGFEAMMGLAGNEYFMKRGGQTSESANNDYEITPDMDIFRTSGTRDDNINNSGAAYVSTNRTDAAIYDRYLAPRNKNGDVSLLANKFRNQYKSKKNIKVAGLDTQRDILRSIAKSEGKDLTDKEVKEMLFKVNVGLPFRNKKNTPEYTSIYGYGENAKNTERLHDKFMAAIKEKGYGGMVDANDSQVMSKRATILFGNESNDNYEKKSVKNVKFNPIERVKDMVLDPTQPFSREKLKKYLDT